ncbi:hypothetical protein KC320_g155 [Hortaea werneckii]|nr:hypothetical protein KC320_g155 [Hortaea werneckii]
MRKLRTHVRRQLTEGGNAFETPNTYLPDVLTAITLERSDFFSGRVTYFLIQTASAQDLQITSQTPGSRRRCLSHRTPRSRRLGTHVGSVLPRALRWRTGEPAMQTVGGACASGVVSSAWPLVSGCSANGANVLGNNDMPLAKCPKWNIHLRIYNDNEQLAIERQEVRGDDLHVRSRLGEMQKAIGLFNEATEP